MKLLLLYMLWILFEEVCFVFEFFLGCLIDFGWFFVLFKYCLSFMNFGFLRYFWVFFWEILSIFGKFGCFWSGGFFFEDFNGFLSIFLFLWIGGNWCWFGVLFVCILMCLFLDIFFLGFGNGFVLFFCDGLFCIVNWIRVIVFF